MQFIVRNYTVEDLFSFDICTNFAVAEFTFFYFLFSAKSAILSSLKDNAKDLA